MAKTRVGVRPRISPNSTLWNDLLAYYTGDGTPNDALGTYNGTLVNGATYGTGIINQGFSFDGVNDYVDLGDILNNDGTQSQSVSFWVKLNSTTTQFFVGKMNHSAPYNGWQVGLYNQKVNYVFANVIPSKMIQSQNSQTLTTGVFYNITVTYDGSKTPLGLKIYIDGNLGTQNILTNNLGSDSSNSNGIKTTISSRNGVTIPVNGIIDEVGIWNRELTASEVTQLYNSGSGKQYPN